VSGDWERNLYSDIVSHSSLPEPSNETDEARAWSSPSACKSVFSGRGSIEDANGRGKATLIAFQDEARRTARQRGGEWRCCIAVEKATVRPFAASAWNPSCQKLRGIDLLY
jgi:hypothetical protein